MKTRNALFLILFAAIAIVSLSLTPSVVTAAENVTTYMVVTVGNVAPDVVIAWTTPGTSFNPDATVTINANATDDNGQSDIVLVNVTYTGAGGESYYYKMSYVSGVLYQNDSLVLPHNATPGTWQANVSAIDQAGATDYYDATFTVNTIVSIELLNTPVNFSTLTTGQTDQEALNHLQINNTGNINLNYTIEGLDLVGVNDGGYEIGVSNVTYDATSAYDFGDEVTLTTSAVKFAGDKAPPSLTNVSFRIDISTGLANQDYKGNLTIRAVQS